MAHGRKTGGRSKGTPNRVSGELREMIEGALDTLGGEKWLVEAAGENPAAFLGLLGKLLPKDITHGGDVTVSHRLVIRD